MRDIKVFHLFILIIVLQWLYLQDGWWYTEHWEEGNRISYQIAELSEGRGYQ